MPTIQEILNSSESLKRFIRRLPHLYKTNPVGDEPQAESWMHRWLYALSHEDDQLWETLDKILKSRSIELAEGFGLTMLAKNFNIERQWPWLEDDQLRNRLRLRILEITCDGTPAQVLEIIARLIYMWQTEWHGEWNSQAWKEIVSRINIFENEIPQYLDGAYRAAHYLIVIPYEYLEIESYPAFELSNGTDWEDDSVHGFDAGIWDGRTLLEEISDVLRVISVAGVYGEIWRDAFEFSDDDDWADDEYCGFDAAPLSDADHTFALRTDAEWEYPLQQGYYLEGFPMQRLVRHPYLDVEVP